MPLFDSVVARLTDLKEALPPLKYVVEDHGRIDLGHGHRPARRRGDRARPHRGLTRAARLAARPRVGADGGCGAAARQASERVHSAIMRSRRLLLVLSLALAFVAGFGLAALLERSGSTASARGQADLYRKILDDLQHDYYRPVNVAQLGQSGISGLLASLHDPYTVYFTPQQAKAFDQGLSGSYTGIGTAVELKDGRLTVTQVFPGSPAAAAGIRPGDVIVSIAGRDHHGRVGRRGRRPDSRVGRQLGVGLVVRDTSGRTTDA